MGECRAAAETRRPIIWEVLPHALWLRAKMHRRPHATYQRTGACMRIKGEEEMEWYVRAQEPKTPDRPGGATKNPTKEVPFTRLR